MLMYEHVHCAFLVNFLSDLVSQLSVLLIHLWPISNKKFPRFSSGLVSQLSVLLIHLRPCYGLHFRITGKQSTPIADYCKLTLIYNYTMKG